MKRVYQARTVVEARRRLRNVRRRREDVTSNELIALEAEHLHQRHLKVVKKALLLLVKAYFRQGLAHLARDNFDLAKAATAIFARAFQPRDSEQMIGIP